MTAPPHAGVSTRIRAAPRHGRQLQAGQMVKRS
jgi:hypothetical protein